MECIIKLNGHEYPYPRRGLSGRIVTLIESGVNANGVTVGQRVGRDRQQIEDLQWDWLPAETWASILQEFSSGTASLTYPDMTTAQWTTRTVFIGDRSAVPWRLNPETGLPKDYRDCRVAVTDIGA